MLEEAVEDLTRYPHIQSIDKSLSSNKYLNLIEDHSRHHSFILTQLRMGHSPLNQHLFRIHCSETPTCPHCQGLMPETVCHFLLICPHYQNEHHRLRRKLRQKAESISFILSNPITSKPLLSYIHATKHFKIKTTTVTTNPTTHACTPAIPVTIAPAN